MGTDNQRAKGWDSSYWTSPVRIQECPRLVKPILGHLFLSAVGRGVLRFSCWQERLWFAHQWSCARVTNHRNHSSEQSMGQDLGLGQMLWLLAMSRTREIGNLTTKACWILSCPTQLHHCLENNWCAAVRPVDNLPVVLRAPEQPWITKLFSGREGSLSSVLSHNLSCRVFSQSNKKSYFLQGRRRWT